MIKVQLWLATWFGAGYLPLMPGTWGALAALPLWWLLQHLRLPVYGFLVLVLLLLAVVVSATGVGHFQHPDPGAVVIDEVVGQLIALAGCPPSWGPVLAGFGLFRFFDILKPFPGRWLEANLPGGWGIVMDDVAAGFYAWLTLTVIRYLGWL